MKIKFPHVVKGCVAPYSVQEKIAKEEQSRKTKTLNWLKNNALEIIAIIISIIALLKP